MLKFCLAGFQDLTVICFGLMHAYPASQTWLGLGLGL